MDKAVRAITITSLLLVLSACGGGGGGNNAAPPAQDSAANNSTGNTGQGTAPTVTNPGSGSSGSAVTNNNSSGQPASTVPSSGTTGSTGSTGNTGGTASNTTPATTPTVSAFSATVTKAPDSWNGTQYLSGTVRLEVQGSGMRNVELLPESGYSPSLASFNISDDGSFAYLDLDTRLIAKGGIKLRISAFDQAAGTPGAREIIAMPARTWLIDNPGDISGTPAARAIACLSVGQRYTSLNDTLPVVCINGTIPENPIPHDQCTSKRFYLPYALPGDGRTVFRNGQLAPALACVFEASGGQVHPDCICSGQ